MAMTQTDRATDLCRMGVTELTQGYRAGRFSPVEVTRATLDRIAELNPRLNAFLTVLEESALASATASEQLFKAGIDLGPLQGVPVSVKDIINVRGTRTTAASPQLLDAPLDEEDAPVVTRLRQAGAVLVGKTNLHEFASGLPDENGPYGWVQNPRRVGYQPGSSSSGAGVATAAGMSVISIGTDTGGSIRIPSILCGVVGLKATYGRVPVRGVLPLSWYLDHVGPLARSVADAAYCLEAIAGYDPGDRHASPAPVDDYSSAIGRHPRGLRVGVAVNDFFQESDPVVLATFRQAIGALRDLGLTTPEFELPRVEETPKLTQVLIQVDGSAYHEQYRGREDRYGANFKEFVLPGRDIGGIEYVQARRAQEELTAEWLRLFEFFDLIATPGCPIVAPRHGQTEIEVNGQMRNVRMQLSRFTRAFNLAGFPALTMPTGVNPDGLPTSIQLVAPPFQEARLIAAAHALEESLGVARRMTIDVGQ